MGVEHFLAAADFEDTQAAAVAARGHHLSVARQGQAEQVVRRRAELLHFLAVGHVPDAQVLVEADREDLVAVGREQDRGDAVADLLGLFLLLLFLFLFFLLFLFLLFLLLVLVLLF